MRTKCESPASSGKKTGCFGGSAGKAVLALALVNAAWAGNVDYVNPLIGTGGSVPSDCDTMPLVEPPFAMTSWTPQTRQDKVGGDSYNYNDTNISGFMGTHQPCLWMGDYGYVTLMPEVDSIKTTPAARQLPFTHAGETTTPCYYSVSMNAGSSRTVTGEITATDHSAIMRFTYPSNVNSSIVVEATRGSVAGCVAISTNVQEIDGYNPDRMDANLTTLQLPNFKGYFVIQISKPFAGFGAYTGSTVQAGVTNLMGTNVGAYAMFSTTQNEQVLVKIGTSFISLPQARSNLNAEIPGWDFDGTKTNLQNIWNQKLGGVSLQGGTSDQVTQFYTAMYHAMHYPREFSENGQYYSAFDDQVHSGVAYTDYSGWDIFRAENSFITIFCPERVNDMVQALLNDYQEGGWMPKWPNPSYTDIMISTPADSIVAEAINKGFNGFDYDLAYQAVYQDAMTPPNNDVSNTWPDRSQGQPYSAREGLTFYKLLGYCANDKTARSASCTLEGAYDDWCVAQVAKAAGNTNDYRFFNDRSLNYRNVFHVTTGLMEARNTDGSWAGGASYGFTEGGQSMYTFAVMHDVPGLINLMGGASNFNNTLTGFTSNLPGLLSNEPGEHYPYLYDFSGTPWLAQSMVRMALTNYSNTPKGIPGNDDCGQLSSWWLFTVMGFYPVNPASGVYMIGSPLFDRVTLNLPNGNTFIIAATNNSATNVYVQSASLNGVALNVPCVTYAQIEAGGTLGFVMGPSPSTWAANWSGTPLERLNEIPGTWTGLAGNADWNAVENWTSSNAPLAGSLLFFDGDVQTATTNNLAASTQFDGIFFNSGAGAFNLHGNSIVLGIPAVSGVTGSGDITNNSTSDETISLGLTLAAGNHQFSTSAAGRLNLNGTITRNPGATVTFTPDTGAINVNGSGLANDASRGGGILGGWAGIGADWATISSGDIAAYASYTIVSPGGTIANNATNNVKITNSGTTRTATLNASGATRINTLLVNAGVNNVQTINIGAGNTLQLGPIGGIFRTDSNPNNNALAITGGSLTAGGASAGACELVINGGFDAATNGLTDINISTARIIDNPAGGALTLTKTGRGYLQLGSANSYTGGTFINEGRIQVTTNGFGTGNVIVQSGGEAFFYSGAAGVSVGAITNNFFISGIGPVNEFGNGALRLALGTLSGTITLLADSSIAGISAGPGTIAGQITDGTNVCRLLFGYLNAQQNSGPITIILGNPKNNWHGDTSLATRTGSTAADFTLQLGANEVIPNGPGFGNVILADNEVTASKTMLDLNGHNETINGLSIGAGLVGDAIVLNNAASTTGTLTLGDGDASAVFGGIVEDNGGTGGTLSLTKIGAGTQTLAGVNTYTGNTTISNGTLALSGSGSIASPELIVASGATFDVCGLLNTNVIVNGFTNIFLLASGQTLSNSSSTAIIKGSVNSGSGTLSLTYNGSMPSFTVANGTLTLSAGTVLKVNNTGSALGVGTYTLIGTNISGVVAGTVPSSYTVGGNGVLGTCLSSLAIISSNTLDLVVSTVLGSTIINPAVNGSGNPTFSGTGGSPNYIYGVESTTSLSGSPTWVEAGTTTTDGTGSWSFTDTSKTNPPTIFYRVYYPNNPSSPPQ